MNVESISSRVTLRDGMTMPVVGLGCWGMSDSNSTYDAIRTAVSEGYRLFDTAQNYKHDSVVGPALKDSKLSREEFFVVTKLMADNPGYNEAKDNLEITLKQSGLDYVDLYLIHTPRNGKIVETWKAFTELKEAGLTKSIGVSNFNVQRLQPLIDTGMEIPAVNQFEIHPWNQFRSTVEFCRKHNIAVMGYTSLARGKLFKDGLYPEIDEISQRYYKTKAQIVLKWAIQSGFIIIPRSQNKERIKENGDLFKWSLSHDDMELINNLNEDLVISTGSSAAMCTEWLG